MVRGLAAHKSGKQVAAAVELYQAWTVAKAASQVESRMPRSISSLLSSLLGSLAAETDSSARGSGSSLPTIGFVPLLPDCRQTHASQPRNGMLVSG